MAGDEKLRLVLCLLPIFHLSSAYYFEPGFDHHYTYSSRSNLLGMHDVTTILKFRVSAVNTTADSNGNFHRLQMDSFIQHTQDGYMTENPKKWDLKRSFLFQMSNNGVVSFVHYHPEDQEELVTLKKVLAGVLSANVKKFHDDKVNSFTVKEIDHTGDLEHKYEMSRKSDGFEVRRVHQSSEHVHRLHNKTLHYDDKGTVHTVTLEDNIMLHKSTPVEERKLMEGEHKIDDSASGEFPSISSSSTTQMKLTNKRRLPFEDLHHVSATHGLVSDLLIVVEKPKPKKELSEVNDTMESLIRCIHSHENKFAPNRTECVTKLRDIFTGQLNDEDYKTIAEKSLNTTCHPNDTLCRDHKNLFIDLISKKGDNQSQTMVIKYILKSPRAEEPEIHRCLLLCIALKNPIKELVRVVEEFCFGENDALHGSEKLKDTQRRSCLTLGALVKTIQNKDSVAAHRIVGKLETWLDHHNETRSNGIIKPRMKRSVEKVDHVRMNHIETKMVLLHALGNAGMSRSVDHILSYMKPNQGTLAWRRAGIDGLRHFRCNKSAEALFVSSIEDDSDIVRDLAFEMYHEHPEGSVNITEKQRHTILEKRYTYPVLMRLKRGVFDASFKDGLFFAINLPGIDWQKTIGSKDIGASFGLVIRNRLELELKPLEGHFEVDVYDTAFAEAHVGLLNLKIDIIRALLCYKGHIGYNMNILKDFGINDIQDVVHIFDRIVATVVDPIKEAVENFKQLINFFKDGGIQKLFDMIVDFIKNLPQKLKEIGEKMVQMVLEVVDYGGFAIIQKIKNIVVKIRTFVEDVQEDIMNFYQNLVDSVTITLPYIGKTLMDAIAKIVSSMTQLLQNPMQALTGIGESIIKIKMAITMFIDVKNQILDVCFFSKGKSPFWMSLGDELMDIISAAKSVIGLISGSSRGRRSTGFFFGSSTKSTTALSDGILTSQDQFSKIKEKLIEKFKEMFNTLGGMNNIGGPFFKTLKSIMDIIRRVKSGYEFLRDVIQRAKSLIDKIFGPKFAKKFPKKRRKENAECGQGIFPSTSEGDFKTTGVDLLISSNGKIPMPVNGMVYKSGSSQVRIRPKGRSMAQYEIVIDNIIPERNVTTNGLFSASGKLIGKAGTSKCQPNFIHVAMRKVQTGVGAGTNNGRRRRDTETQDANADYMDPSPYLDKGLPTPQWIEDCNDHYFKFLGQTFDTGASSKNGAKKKLSDIKRNGEASDKMKEFTSMDPSKEPAFRPPNYDPTAANSMNGNFAGGIKDQMGSFTNVGNMFGGSSKAPNILDFFDINKFTICKLKSLISDSNLIKQLDDISQKLETEIKNSPAQHPEGISVSKLQNLMTRTKQSVVGDRMSMISGMLSSAENDCSTFSGGRAKGFGHVFTAHSNCQGVTCGISLPYGAVNKITKVDVKADKCNNKIIMTTINADPTDVPLDGVDHQITLESEIHEGLSTNIIVNAELQNDRVVVSVEAILCSNVYSTCLPDIQVLTDVQFADSGPCGPDSVPDSGGSDVCAMTLSVFQATLSQYHLLNGDILRLFNKIRDVALEELMKDPRKFFGTSGEEFPNSMDMCINNRFPVPPFDITFFDVSFRFMVGPVPLALGFGAGGSVGVDITLGFCFMSLTAKAVVTPWIGGKVWGSLSVDIFIARGGIRLIGYLLETRFPITASIGFSKFPLDVTGRMDMELTPIRLELLAFAELNLFIKYVTVFEGSIWKYKAPTIRRNIFTTKRDGKDNSPPEFTPSTFNSRKKREGPRGCILKQVENLDPVDTTFMLEVATQDEVSDVKLFYAIGTQRGGTNVVDWTEMGGASLVVPTSLPGGIPLHWTVKAGNSQGLFAYSHCMLNTFDSTIPDGRVDPSYPYSSHPNKLSGTVVVFDDSPLVDSHLVAIGYSPGEFGSEFRTWDTLQLQSTKSRQGVNNNLKYFSIPSEGKLTSKPFKTITVEKDFDCATECVNFGAKCVSFDFEYHSETCDLHEFVQGPNAKLRISGTYKNYERLGVGSNSFVSFENLELVHGGSYFINAKITNTLGYKSYLVSEGTIVDYTPPESGPLGERYQESMFAHGCRAAVTQRCTEVTWKDNHRKIIDGIGATTVFNGHKPLEDQLYTLANHYASVNFDGFHDNETGIWGYTWAVGTQICGSDVVSFRDPHAHLSSTKYWTNSGYMKDLQMEDGPYYVTVQALNNIVYGGALVTTVCHSTPFTVDTTPPIFEGVTEIFYDEDFDILAVYFKASDPLSNLSRVDFGLGKTKHDVLVRGYSRHTYVDRKEPFVAVSELGLEEGVPAWIRIRAVNNVDLFKSGHGDEPILIDRSPPIAGEVMDGDLLRRDIKYQSDTTRICAQWINFFDPESGIDSFIWGVGSTKGEDNVVKFHNLTHHQKHACADVSLQHNHTYYSTVVALNSALNQKHVNSSSDGVLVDITPPLPGWVKDGKDTSQDIEYSSETATKNCYWGNFSDPESHIHNYEVSVYINSEMVKTFAADLKTTFEDHSIAMRHLDRVEFEVTGTNGAGLEKPVMSSGFLVDHTPPVIEYIRDTLSGAKYQAFDNKLQLSWKYDDTDSGIKEYRYFVYEQKQGMKSRFWPTHDKYKYSTTSSPNDAAVKEEINALTLTNGAKYSVHVIAINGALISSSHESDGVIVDTTPPIITKVHIGLPKEEEELDDSGKYVLHADPNGITVSMKGRDPESGIANVYVALGKAPNDTSVTAGFLDIGSEVSYHITGLSLDVYSETHTRYYISVKAKNGAGSFSDIASSKPITIQKANIPGIIYDGRTEFTDSDYTIDKTSIALTFGGFESESCNIISYEWAVGTEPYQSDILPYTGYGLVLHNTSHGHAQIHAQLYEDSVYYTSVRAKTGHKCHDEYIVSSSDGIKLDTKEPSFNYIGPEQNDSRYETSHGKIFQSFTDSLDLTWEVTDKSPTKNVTYSLGSLPFENDVHPVAVIENDRLPVGLVSLPPGKAIYLALQADDEAGNRGGKHSFPVMADTSAPLVHNFNCTPFLSVMQSLVTCKWLTVEEYESTLQTISISLGSVPLGNDLHESTAVSFGRRSWTRDLKDILQYKNITEVHVTIVVTNILMQEESFTYITSVDLTPPDQATIEFVTSIQIKPTNTKQLCQIPFSFMEISMRDLVDEESGIEKIEVCLGSSREQSDIKEFQYINDPNRIFIDGVALRDGSHVYATARIYNGAGLYSLVSSEPIVVSHNPVLKVTDGPTEIDIDYQSELNVIQGRWKYSDPCPIVSVEWAIEDITGTIVQEYKTIPGNLNFFYNDEITTQNGYLYIVKVRTKDALNRIRESESDGVAIRIQPPNPGPVRDGLEKTDIDYQQSVQELSANWDSFGDPASKDPTQRIVRYEVAIGNDRRYAKTRTNVHYFVDVGLNTNFTFINLNLTAKIVKYYITVRAYSEAGSFDEGYSNGIRVGFKDGIQRGVVEVQPYQSNTEILSVSWSGFESDIGIKYYQVAVGTKYMQFSNQSIPCQTLEEDGFDTQPMSNMGLNTFAEIVNLTLEHNKLYYPTVIAVDESDMCQAVIGSPILIDTTPPDAVNADILLDGRSTKGRDVLYITDLSRLEIKWINVSDKESGIENVFITFEGISGCPSAQAVENSDFKVTQVTVINDTLITLYDLGLFPNKFYFVKLVYLNRAGFNSTIVSPFLLVDTTPPFSGTVKIGADWHNQYSFQFADDHIHAITAVTRSEESYTCPNQMSLIPADSSHDMKWHRIGGDFTKDSVVDTPSSIILMIGYNTQLTKVVKSGIQSDTFSLREGNYTFQGKSAAGRNIITTFAVSSISDARPSEFNPPKPDKFEKPAFNFSDEDSLEVEITSTSQYANATEDTNATTSTGFTTELTTEAATVNITDPMTNNNTSATGSQGQLEDPVKYGFGINILGELQQDAEKWDCLFWAVDRYKNVQQWVTIDFNPKDTSNQFIFEIKKEIAPTKTLWNIALIANGEIKSTINGMQFPGNVSIFSQTWNKDDYEEPITDPFDPFRSQAEVSNIALPIGVEKECLYGKGFFDKDSGIEEIWVGVSENMNSTSNILPMTLYKKYCLPCKDGCTFGCDTSCKESNVSDDFEIREIDIGHLSLESTTLASNTSADTTTYYVNVKVKNFAGLEVLSSSNPVMVDKTPPECQYIKCLDPTHSEDEPTEYLGSNSSIGAYWRCHEDVSDIAHYFVSVGSTPYTSDMFNESDFGLQRKIHLNLTDSVFEHGETYYLNLRVVNSADQSSNYSCHVRVELYPPDVEEVETHALYEVTANAGSKEAELKTAVTHYNDRVGVQWENKHDNVRFYEWKIGSKEGRDDIIPRTKVGVSRSGTAAIFQGHLLMNETKTSMTVGSMAQGRNWTDVNMTEVTKDSTFFMEPGRCMHHSLYAVGVSHLTSEIKMEPTCVTRPEDVILVFNSSKQIEVSKHPSSGFQESSKLSDKELSINITGNVGGAIIGHLEAADLVQDYGSAASFTFNPYIVDPDNTKHLTSLTLRNRLVSYEGLSFFITPASEMTVQNIVVSMQYQSQKFESGTIPALAYWNTDSNIWVHMAEGCTTDLAGKTTDSIYMDEVCLDQLVNSDVQRRRKRSSTATITQPTMFSSFKINSTCFNNEPVIDDNVIDINEDTLLVHYMNWHDTDWPSDSVVFSLSKGPQNGFANLTVDGTLTYISSSLFAGLDNLEVTLTEVNTSCHPYIVSKTITINVIDLNDPPVSGFVTHIGKFHDANVDNNVVLTFEGNETNHFLGTLIVADVDLIDTFTILSKYPTPNSNGVFILNEQFASKLPNNTFPVETVNSFRQFDVSLNVSKEFHGELQFQLVAHDKGRLYTQRVDLHVYILWAPCVYGNCTPQTSTPCSDIIRASTLDPYFCTCDPGYKDEYCQTEINECLPAPCPLMYDCVDKIAAYECNINVAKLMAILICIFIPIGIAAFLLFRCWKSKRAKFAINDSRQMVDLTRRSQRHSIPEDDDPGKPLLYDFKLKNTEEVASLAPSRSSSISIPDADSDDIFKPGLLRRNVVPSKITDEFHYPRKKRTKRKGKGIAKILKDRNDRKINPQSGNTTSKQVEEKQFRKDRRKGSVNDYSKDPTSESSIKQNQKATKQQRRDSLCFSSSGSVISIKEATRREDEDNYFEEMDRGSLMSPIFGSVTPTIVHVSMDEISSSMLSIDKVPGVNC